jgi:sugar phosphate isomerase/epimerase
MLDVGDGVVDWRAILSKQKEAGVRHVFVENDEPKEMLASIARSYRYLRALRY